MFEPVATRLWGAAQKRGGAVFIGDVSFDDIACGKRNGWLAAAGIGHLQATDKLQEAAKVKLERAMARVADENPN